MPRRTRSPHPGLVLAKPRGARLAWRARYTDPDTNRETYARIDPTVVRTAEARREWAIRKARALAQRRLELEGGAPRATGKTLATAVDRFFEDRADLRPATVKAYRAAAVKLLAWAERDGFRSADDLTRAALLRFRGRVIAEPLRAMKAGGKRGERKATGERRGPHAVNKDLRSIRVVLGYLADLDLLPKIREGDLRRATARVRVPTERPEYLSPPALRALLGAALAHDAAKFKATRQEHARGATGATTRYPPIAPLVAGVLLSGMRLGEALALTWDRVDLNARDDAGAAVGELHVTAASKTHRARTVGLDVSPALRALLVALERRSAGKGAVFGVSAHEAKAALRRLVGTFDAPKAFTWQILRGTCATFLVNAPGIFASAAPYREARQLGHSVAVAETHYAGLVRGISREARDLETAVGITAEMDRIIAAGG